MSEVPCDICGSTQWNDWEHLIEAHTQIEQYKTLIHKSMEEIERLKEQLNTCQKVLRLMKI